MVIHLAAEIAVFISLHIVASFVVADNYIYNNNEDFTNSGGAAGIDLYLIRCIMHYLIIYEVHYVYYR